MASRSLLVFAHSDEAEAFARAGVPHLLTGVGKINAALGLTEALLASGQRAADRVVVMGTAGALSDQAKLDTVYQIDSVVQHDYSLPSPKLHPAGLVVAPHTATLATGDVFVQNDAQRAALAALGATLVDMETYAFAAVCARLGVPLQVFKVPSDFADSSTTQEQWDDIAASKSQQLFEFAERQLPDLLG